jgi:hypothetical protein
MEKNQLWRNKKKNALPGLASSLRFPSDLVIPHTINTPSSLFAMGQDGGSKRLPPSSSLHLPISYDCNRNSSEGKIMAWNRSWSSFLTV